MRSENIVTLVASKDEGNEGKRNKRTQILSALLSASALGVFLEGCGGEDTSSGGALPAAPAVRGSESTPLVGTAVEGETFTGTAGKDWVSYAGSTIDAGVTIDLDTLDTDGAATGSGGWAAGDKLKGINNLIGSKGVDTLTGNNLANTLRGGLGADTLEGGGGADTLDGGEGTEDTASYSGSVEGVKVDLSQTDAQEDFDGAQGFTANQGGDAVGDTLSGIENLEGSGQADWLLGNGGVNALSGGAGDDRLEGGADADTLDGGVGDDRLLGGGGADTLEGGDGQDAVDYEDAGEGVRIDLTLKRESATLTGAQRDFDGDNGFASNSNEAVGDILTNVEDIYGSGHDDWINGNENSNILRGRDGDDRLEGGDGNDRLEGGVGNDNLYGDDGDDNLEGGAGTDIIAGGAGDDTLEGGAGDDTLEGGAGTDTYAFNAGDGTDTITDDGGKIVFNQGASNDYAGASYSFAYVEGKVRLTVENGGNTLNAIDFTSYPSGYTFYTRSGSTDSEITLPAVPARDIAGSGGDDILEGGAGTDIIAGGAGDDTLEGGAGDDTLEGGAGMDTYVFNAGDGTDTIDDDGGNIVFDQGTSDDYADATYTFVRADDGRGDAVTLTISKDSKTLNVIEFASDPSSYTFYTRSGSSDSDITSSLPAVPAKRFEGSVGDDNLEGGAGTDILAGGAGDDTLEGGAGDDTLEGGAGTDTYVFNAGDGTDTIDDDGGNIVFDQGTSDDYADATYTFVRADDGRGDAVKLTVSKDSKTLNVIEFASDPSSYTFYTRSGSSDSDITSSLPAVPAKRFEGSGGDDILEGGAGTDIIAGGAGDDTLEGGAGDDTLEGGAGTDTYVFNAGDGTDRIDDDGGNIVFDQGTSDDYADATYTFVRADDGRGDAVKLTVSKDSKTLNVIEFASDPSSYTFYTRSGSSDSDITSSLPAVPAKRFEGSGGDDNLEGGAGTDIIAGGAGDDTLEGGAGDDTLEGGAGTDTYVFNAGDGTDRIDDDGGNIVFDQGASDDYADATYTFVRADDGRGDAVTLTVSKDSKTLNVIEFANDPALGSYTFYTRSGSSDSDITSSLPAVPAKRFEGSAGDDNLEGGAGTDIIAGGAGDDTLEGGAGDDTLEGGAGTDTYAFNAGDGTDTIDDDGGNIVFDQGASDDYANATYTFVRADDGRGDAVTLTISKDSNTLTSSLCCASETV